MLLFVINLALPGIYVPLYTERSGRGMAFFHTKITPKEEKSDSIDPQLII
jgi:hypothetical protein